MSGNLYLRLAVSNIKKNSKTYVPYLITSVFTVSMYYILVSLFDNPATGNGTVSAFLRLGINVLKVFSFIFLFYTNSFLMKQRKKEFGLYNVLGMEKKHIYKIVFLETVIILIITMFLGIIIGLLFSKLVFLALLNLLNFDIKYEFFISLRAMSSSLSLYIPVFAVIFLASVWQISRAKPIELLKGGSKGEKEPGAKWVMAVAGFLFLGIGYGISLATKDMAVIVNRFFLAAILVIIGTYLLFTAGTIAILKILKNNVSYYYKAKHFISVSGIMYRMKQNAAGLATICILSTGVLVMISSTATLYSGLEEGLSSRYPTEIGIRINGYSKESQEKVTEAVTSVLKELDLRAVDITSYRFIHFNPDSEKGYSLVLIPYEDFAQISGNGIPPVPDDNEGLLYSNGVPYNRNTLSIGDITFEVTERFNEFKGVNLSNSYNEDLEPRYYLVVKDMETVSLAAEGASKEKGIPAVSLEIGFNIEEEEASAQNLTLLYQLLYKSFEDNGLFENRQVRLESRTESREVFTETYGGLFFLGIFLTVMSILAAVLIIYYKQLSEGYADKERYGIMGKVGLSKAEAKSAIRGQILNMFFLPLIVACIHLTFAAPSIIRLLGMLNMVNPIEFVTTAGVCVLVFAVFYCIVYLITAKVYHNIVGTANQ